MSTSGTGTPNRSGVGRSSKLLASEYLPRRWVVVTGVLVGAVATVVGLGSSMTDAWVVGWLAAPVVAYYARDFADELFSSFAVGAMAGGVPTAVVFTRGVWQLTTITGDVMFGIWQTMNVTIATAYVLIPSFALEAAIGGALLGTVARRLGLKWR